MQTLPSSDLNISAAVEFKNQPDLTWNINKETDRIQGETSELAAVRQAAEIILNIERFRWQIYKPYSGIQWEGLIGQDPGYVSSELQRRIKDALMMDDRIKGISDFTYFVTGETLSATFTVNTVFGDTQTTVEVNIS